MGSLSLYTLAIRPTFQLLDRAIRADPRCVAFLPQTIEGEAGQGWKLAYQDLTLHALTPAGATPAHIYCQVDDSPPANGVPAEEDEFMIMAEMRIYVAEDEREFSYPLQGGTLMGRVVS